MDIISDNNLDTGYYLFKANSEEYPVHLYNYNGDQVWSENKVFGDAGDISRDVAATDLKPAYRSYAQNMVIVKVNGDLTINEGVTVGPYYTNYGGPKGFTLYVTGKLTNNGTIDNSHGAYAEGQNVYLWKNTDGSYEYVPAVGGAGGAARGGGSQLPGYNGNNGVSVNKRATGGGGSGGHHYSGGGATGAGGAGSSNSGGGLRPGEVPGPSAVLRRRQAPPGPAAEKGRHGPAEAGGNRGGGYGGAESRAGRSLKWKPFALE